VLEEGGELLVVTTGGYGKRTPLTDYPPKGRATRRADHRAEKLKDMGPIAQPGWCNADEFDNHIRWRVVLRTRGQRY